MLIMIVSVLIMMRVFLVLEMEEAIGAALYCVLNIRGRMQSVSISGGLMAPNLFGVCYSVADVLVK